MKNTVHFLFIAVAVSFYCCGVNALVCPLNVCERMQCEKVDETLCSGPDKLIRKGGFCECCDTCFTVVAPIVCLSNFCELMKCPKLNCYEREILDRGGLCNCCNVCMQLRGPGEYCGLPFFGLPPTSILCKEGLSCTGGFCSQQTGINAF